MTLTRAGRLLVERAKPVLRDMERMELAIRRFVERPSGRRLGVFGSAAASPVPLVVQRYRAISEDGDPTDLRLVAAQPDDLQEQLRGGALDMVVTWDYEFAPRATAAGLRRVQLLADPLCAVLPVGHPASAADTIRLAALQGEPWVARSHRPPYDEAVHAMCRLDDFEPDVAL